MSPMRIALVGNTTLMPGPSEPQPARQHARVRRS
jgi:hypothetical protein